MKDDEFKIECEKCGLCCHGFSENKGVILFPEDINRIAENLSITPKTFKKQYCYSEKIFTKRKTLSIYFLRYIDEHCIFLDKSNLCKIHEFKPIQCLKGPIYILWDNELRLLNCKYMKKVKIPEDWSTDEEDLKLISTFYEKV